jgi:hypothetical protein
LNIENFQAYSNSHDLDQEKYSPNGLWTGVDEESDGKSWDEISNKIGVQVSIRDFDYASYWNAFSLWHVLGKKVKNYLNCKNSFETVVNSLNMLVFCFETEERNPAIEVT